MMQMISLRLRSGVHTERGKHDEKAIGSGERMLDRVPCMRQEFRSGAVSRIPEQREGEGADEACMLILLRTGKPEGV